MSIWEWNPVQASSAHSSYAAVHSMTVGMTWKRPNLCSWSMVSPTSPWTLQSKPLLSAPPSFPFSEPPPPPLLPRRPPRDSSSSRPADPRAPCTAFPWPGGSPAGPFPSHFAAHNWTAFCRHCGSRFDREHCARIAALRPRCSALQSKWPWSR